MSKGCLNVVIGICIEFMAERVWNAYRQYRFHMKQKRLSDDFQSGKLSINDIRKKYNLPPLEGCDVRVTTELSSKNKDLNDLEHHGGTKV